MDGLAISFHKKPKMWMLHINDTVYTRAIASISNLASWRIGMACRPVHNELEWRC